MRQVRLPVLTGRVLPMVPVRQRVLAVRLVRVRQELAQGLPWFSGWMAG